MAVLRYGADSSVQLEFPEGVPPAQYGTPQESPLEDLAVAVTEALDSPLDYPPLSRSTTPGDRVVLALDQGIPQAAQIASAVIQSLIRAGVHPDGISILLTRSDRDPLAKDLHSRMPEPLKQCVPVFTHDPADRTGLAYLAATDAGEPILLCRLLTDADLVLPIGCFRGDGAAGYYGIHTTIFPTFSDQRTLARFHSLGSLNAWGKHKKALVAEVEQVGWLLGINFTIQLVPADGDRVLEVLAGQSEAVARRGRQLYRSAWNCPALRRASLVVAAIGGGVGQQTWENLGRALEAAGEFVEDGGSIAVCCELAAPPGPAVQRMIGVRSRAAALRRIGKERPPDALPAAQLARALDRSKVYLLGQLDPSLVEELDMIPIAGGDELARLARRHNSSILLANAQHVMTSPAIEDSG